MNSSNKKLTDTLIGEATLTLITNRKQVNPQALLNELNTMRQQEIDTDRLTALQSAISEIQIYITSKEADSAGHRGVKHRKGGRKEISMNETNKNIH